MGYENLIQKLTFYKAFFSPQWKFLIHTILQCLSAKTTAWNEFSNTMASAIICLATNKKFNFSKYIFEHMVKNLEDGVNFLMFPRFMQVFLDSQVKGMLKHKEIYVSPSHTKKIFANMKRQGKYFFGMVTPLFETMMVQAQEDMVKHVTTSSNDLLSGLGYQEDASKQERMIEDLDADEGVALVDETQGRNDQEMFDISIFDDEEVVFEKEVSTIDPVITASEVVTTAGVEVSAAAITSQISMDKITLSKDLIDLKKSKPKAKGIVMKEPSEIPTPTLKDTSQQLSKAKDKGKVKMIKPEKPLKRKDQKAELEEEERLARQKKEEDNIALIK
nr:hypothetical protein [Tanacetum cinerariifolium]